jgi:hypothetical protein
MKTILRNISRMFSTMVAAIPGLFRPGTSPQRGVDYLQESTKSLTKAAEMLSDLIKARA